MVPLSADRRAGLSGPPSTAGSVPATAESLQADLREMYRPDQEPAGSFVAGSPNCLLPACGGQHCEGGRKAPQPELGAACLGAPVGQPVAAKPGAPAKEQAPAAPTGAGGFARGDSPLRARLAALEMELEALKRGSDGGASVAEGGQAADLAAALKEQTEALKEALSARGGSNSITTVKTDLVWPTLTDDKSDTKHVVLFYEEFEDVCALANNCRGMSAREKLLALRARCKCVAGQDLHKRLYRAAWKTGEVVDDPEAVYLRIKNKHLMFGESREEREVRIDREHQALVKGRLSGHQFEPLFEASVADLESVGLGKTARELYLSYLRKMPPHLQKEIRQDKRIWLGDAKEVGLRSPATWEESHFEYEQREAAHRAVAHPTYSTTAGEPSDPSAALAKAQKEIRELKAAAKAAAARPSGAAAKDSTLAAGSGAKGGGKGAAGKICFHFRDHENCPKGDSCPFSHDKELRKQALAAKRGEGTLAAKGGKGGGKGGGKASAAKAKVKAKSKAAAKSTPKLPGTVCPFFQTGCDGLVQEGRELRHRAQFARRARASLAGQLGPRERP